MNALEIRGLGKHYDGFDLDHVDLTLPNGCIMGLIGENGAGKTTTIKLILDIIRRDEGTISIFGSEGGILDKKQDIGAVMDQVGFNGCLRVADINKIMAATFTRWDEKKFRELMHMFEMPMNKKFSDLSKGMKMKMGIIVALSHDPKLLILDEATSGLDPVVRDEMLEVFNDFTRDPDRSILISSHIVSDLEKICDYIAFMHRGRIVLCEEKDVLREKYALLRCDQNVLEGLEPKAVLGYRSNSYGSEAIVVRDMVPGEFELSPVDIEDVFIAMTKEVS